MARKRSRTQNAVLFHHPDAVDTGRARLLGRHSAGEGFLKGFVRHSGVPAFFGHTLAGDHFEDFRRRVAALDDKNRPCRRVPLGAMGTDDAAGDGSQTPKTLMLPDPLLAPFAWRRRGIGDRAYSLCGLTHTVASDRVMDGLGELLVAPTQPWDAVICTSEATRAVVVRLLDDWADYLGRRTGGKIEPKFQLPVIPLGVDCDAYAGGDRAEAERRTIRRGLGIDEDDVAVLFLGRLSFHAKAHPTPLYLALEEAAKRTGKRIHLLQVGWFATDGIEKEFRDGLMRYAPSVKGIFLDGRQPDVRFKVWFAADVFTSLSDNIQETFGLTPIEAMAAGLPVVVSDWDGYRDTVRPGTDGFTVPTWMPLPESGGDLALAPEARLTPDTSDQAYEQYCGVVSQATAIDVAAAAEAFAALAADPNRRRRMGAAGRKRARQTFDWRVVVKAYQDLWRDLENVRNRERAIAPVIAGRPAAPLRADPFSLYAGHPTHSVDATTRVALAPSVGKGGGKEGWVRRLKAIGRQRMNVFAAATLLGDDDQRKILGALADDGPADVLTLADMLPEERRYRLSRTLAWLAKMGIVQLAAGKGGGKAAGSKAGGLGAKRSGKPTAWSLVEQGVEARRRGALKDAEALFEQALAAEPDDAVARTQLGELAAFAGRLADARENFEHALAASPDYQPAQRNLGKVLFLEGDYGAARAALAKAADMTPSDSDTRYLLGIACRYAGRAEEALGHLRTALDNGTAGGDALAQLGLALKGLGRADEAAEKFQAALETEPGNVLADCALTTIKAADKGRRAAEKGGKRVALYAHARYHAALLKPLFEAFNDGHWPAISADARDAAAFGPAVAVICDAPVPRLAAMMPKAAMVNVRHTLAERNFAGRDVRQADYVCVPGAMMRDKLLAAGLPESRVWVTGYAPNDPLFRGERLKLPFKLPKAMKTVLYAPTHYPPFSSAAMLGADVAALIAGARDDVTVIVKPHPATCETRPDWMAAWRRAAEADARLRLVAESAADAAPLLMAADVLVSDAAGVIFQYLAVDRPIVLVRNPAAADDARYDADAIEWRWRDIGEEVTDVKALSAAVERGLDDPDADAARRAEYRRLLFDDLDDGGAGERIVERVAGLKL